MRETGRGLFFRVGLWFGTVQGATDESLAVRRPAWPRRLWGAAKRLGPAGPLALLSGALPPLGGTVVILMIPVIAPWLRDHGYLGPPLAVLLGAALGATMILPMYSFMAVCGWAFGPVVGVGTALCGVVLGALLNYAWARLVCRDRVTQLIEEKPKWAVVYRELIHASPGRALLLATLIRIPPGFPFALTNFLMAAVRVPLKTVLLAAFFGSIPRTVVVAVTAAKLSSLSEQQKLGPWTIGLAVAGTVLSLVVISRLAMRALARATAGAGAGAGDGVAVAAPNAGRS